MPGFLAAAGAGAALGVYGRSQEISNLNDQKNLLQKQKKYIRQAAEQNKALLQIKAENVATEATENSKSSAISAFQNQSAGNSAASQMGIASGSPFYKVGVDFSNAMDSMATQDKVAINNQDAIVRESNLNDINTNQQLSGINAQLKNLDKQLSYADSPLSWAMSMGSGAMNGVSFAASAMSAYKEWVGHTESESAVASITGQSNSLSKLSPSSPSFTPMATEAFDSNMLQSDSDTITFNKSLYNKYDYLFGQSNKGF